MITDALSEIKYLCNRLGILNFTYNTKGEKMYINGETIAIAVSIISLITALVTVSWKLFKWINHQKEQDEKIKQLEERHKADQSGLQEEQTLIIYGLLACLKGLKEQGCNGPVSEAVEKIEKHLNKQAHRS